MQYCPAVSESAGSTSHGGINEEDLNHGNGKQSFSRAGRRSCDRDAGSTDLEDTVEWIPGSCDQFDGSIGRSENRWARRVGAVCRTVGSSVPYPRGLQQDGEAARVGRLQSSGIEINQQQGTVQQFGRRHSAKSQLNAGV